VRRKTTFLTGTKFACSGHPTNFLLIYYVGIATPVYSYNTPVNFIGKLDFPDPSPEPIVEEEEEEENMRMSWKHILLLLTRWDP